MGRFFVLTALLLAAFTVPAALSADTPGDGTLSVKRGRGSVVLKLKGTVIGRLTTGKVQVKDFRPFDSNVPLFTGCKVKHPTMYLAVCQGRKIGYRVLDGRFNVNVRGSGIWISAVGSGTVTVDGRGEDGFPDGVMSMNDQPYESLPDDTTTLPLEAPLPGSKRLSLAS
jgi:hypothetical protein